MQGNLSKDQMIYENYVGVNTLKERIDRHSIEHAKMFEKIFHELQDLKQAYYHKTETQRDVIEKQNERILKIETEKNIAIKVLVPIISIIVTFLTNFFSKKI